MALWVFGYGSLIWDAGFEPAERQPARLDGWRRAFCMWSVHYRGTPEAPGLVLALDRAEGAACKGLALRVREGEEAPVLAGLRARELISSAYREEECRLHLADGRELAALTYVIDRAHPQYSGALTREAQAAIIARATGTRGPNDAYLHRTAERLLALGLPDDELMALCAQVRALKAAQAGGGGAPAPSRSLPEAGVPNAGRVGPLSRAEGGRGRVSP